MPKATPHYKWERVGDQDQTVRLLCYLGPYMLEHVEEHWDEGKMLMASRVWLWNDEEQCPDLLEELPEAEYERNESYKCLEDWYALNVLFEEAFIGTIDFGEPNEDEDE